MGVATFKDRLRDLATKDLKLAIEECKKGIVKTSELSRDLINLQGRHNTHLKKVRNGLWSNANEDQSLNNVRNSFLSLIDEIEEEHTTAFLQYREDVAALQQKVNALETTIKHLQKQPAPESGLTRAEVEQLVQQMLAQQKHEITSSTVEDAQRLKKEVPALQQKLNQLEDKIKQLSTEASRKPALGKAEMKKLVEDIIEGKLLTQQQTILQELEAGLSELEEKIAATPTPNIEVNAPAPAAQSFDFPVPEMVFVEGGTFIMGSNDGPDNEKPVHQVTLPSFYICTYPVTQLEWQAIMDDNPSIFEGDNRPVEKVSWEDVQIYLKKLKAKTGWAVRLPSEAEWEYAARGGQLSKGYVYAGSNRLEEVGWFDANSNEKTQAVGRKRPNELELYDMSGNVWEWCADQFHPSYEGAPVDGSPRLDLHDESPRVVRGGSWNFNDVYCRLPSRIYLHPNGRHSHVGFRFSRY